MKQSKNQAKNRAASKSTRVRIIGGQWRGRKLPVADVDGLRPTGDRVRETLFNWLAPYIHGARCLDLYSGTGALGFEALSRGASFTQFVELNQTVCRQIEANIQLLGADSARLACGDALRWLAAQPSPLDVDVVFIDPPFALDLWNHTLEAFVGGKLKPGTLVYIEAPKNHVFSTPVGWQCLREKHAGQVDYRLFQVEPACIDAAKNV